MLKLTRHELKYYFKNLHELIYIYGLFFIIILIPPLGLRLQLHLLPELAPSMIWIALISCVSIGSISLFQRDAESGALEQYQLLPQGVGPLVLGKWLAYYLAVIGPIALAMPLALGLYGLPLGLGMHYIAGVALGGCAISLLASLAAAMTAGLERARAVMLLLVMPLSVPVMIFGSEYLRHTEQLWQPNLMFMGAFSLFLMPILWLAGSGCIRASN